MISVCIVGAENSGNLGAVARIMKNFDFYKLFLINPECEVLCDESRARAMHGYDVLKKAEQVNSLKEISADYLVATSAKLGTGNTLFRIPLTPEKLAQNIENNLHYCIVIGRESKGLYNTEIEECDLLLHIPASKDYSTLNISHALGIILYELFTKKSLLESRIASREEREIVIMLAGRALENTDNKEDYLEVLENVMNRGFVLKKEVRALSGLFGNIIKK